MYIEAVGRKIYYEQAGTGEHLLILHGWGVSSEIYRPLFLELAKERTVRIMDFPGFGLSPAPPDTWGTTEYAALVAALLEKWGVKKTDILAHSFGARVALKVAHARPELVGRMVLTGAAGIRNVKRIPPAKRLLGLLGKSAGKLGHIGAPLKRWIYSKIGSADYLAAGAMRPILVRVVNEDLSGIMKQVGHRTLLLWGEKDTATPLEDGKKMNEYMANSRLEVIEGAGHYAFSERPAPFIERARSFLEET